MLILIRKKLIVILLITVIINGCTFASVSKKNSKNISDLNMGQSIKETLDEMGLPDKNEKYVLRGQETAIWFYKVSPGFDRIGQDNDLMPLVFENGTLIGWGRDVYYQTINDLKR